MQRQADPTEDKPVRDLVHIGIERRKKSFDTPRPEPRSNRQERGVGKGEVDVTQD